MKSDSLIKKIAAINDISGFGRASLTTIIPVLAAMGIQTCPVPTAVLSTHTGGFDEYTFKDLTGEIPAYINHWKTLGLSFECVYSGFLGSVKQISIVEDIIEAFKTDDNLILVDPVMGDDNKIYSSMDISIVPAMRNLIKYADLITPNYTEAKLLLNTDEPSSPDTAKKWLRQLSDMGPANVIITSYPLNDNSICTLAYDKKSDKSWMVPTELLLVNYPGTGDLFASVLIGHMLNGKDLPTATAAASEFVYDCMKMSSTFDYPSREGVLLERMLPQLLKPLNNPKYKEL